MLAGYLTSPSPCGATCRFRAIFALSFFRIASSVWELSRIFT